FMDGQPNHVEEAAVLQIADGKSIGNEYGEDGEPAPELFRRNLVPLHLGQTHHRADYGTTMRGTRREMLHRISYGIVPQMRACSHASMDLPPCSPMMTASSPTFAEGISVTSTSVMSIETRPTIGASE